MKLPLSTVCYLHISYSIARIDFVLVSSRGECSILKDQLALRVDILQSRSDTFSQLQMQVCSGRYFDQNSFAL